MMTKRAVHPGQLIEPLILLPAGLSQSAFSRKLGFNQPQPVNELIKGKRGVTPKMALLIERATQGEYPAEFWLLSQLRWDLSLARDSMPNQRIGMVESVPVSGKAADSIEQSEQHKAFALSQKIQALNTAEES